MSNRSAKFVAAIFASILAGTGFAAMAQDAAKQGAKTADSCLSGPKGPLPAGGHWYYRVDRETKRNCWYIGEQKSKSARIVPKDSTPPAEAAPAPPVAANPASPPPDVNMRKSIADARAEFTAPRARLQDLTEPQTGAEPAAGAASGERATAADAPPPLSNVASRWPESSGVTSSSAPRLAASEPSQSQPSPSQQPPQIQAPQVRKQTPKPAVTPVALAAADSLQERQSASTQMLLLTMAGALALAGITASLVFRLGRSRQALPEMRGDRRAIWDQVPAELKSPSMLPVDDIPIWRRDPPPGDLPKDPRAPDDPERRVTEMLARLARTAQS